MCFGKKDPRKWAMGHLQGLLASAWWWSCFMSLPRIILRMARRTAPLNPTITVTFHPSSTERSKTLTHALKSPSERAACLEELYCLDWGAEWSHFLGI